MRHPYQGVQNRPAVDHGDHPHHYNPNQPRVPAGYQGGGQWTGGGFSGHRTEQPDTPDRHRLLDAVLGRSEANTGVANVRLALFDESKARALANAPRFRLPRIPITPAIAAAIRGLPLLGAAATLYALLSPFDDDDQQTVVAFKAREYRRGKVEERKFDPSGVITLKREDVRAICGKDIYDAIQKIVDDKFDEVMKEGKKLSPQQFGTEVHERIKKEIRNRGYKNVSAELSFPKEESQDGKDHYGAKDTARLDVYIRVDKETVCVIDAKTLRRGLGPQQMTDYVKAVDRSDKDKEIKNILVIEMRPRNAPVSRPKRTLQSE